MDLLLQIFAQDRATVIEFYKTVSGLSFTLLGLWWVALELRYREWQESARAIRHAYGILLFFLLPGLMSLFSLIDDSGTWWRVIFGATAIAGVAEIGLYYVDDTAQRLKRADIMRVIGFFDYIFILLVAIRPQIGDDLGLGLAGIQVEAILSGALIVIGVHLAFLAMIDRRLGD